MAGLPLHIQGYAVVDSATAETALSSLPPIPPSPSPSPTMGSYERAPSPPAPTIYLTGFNCIASDPEYAHARHITNDTQPYWFEEAYGAADFNEGVRRRAKQDMKLLEDGVATIDLDDAGNEMDRVIARDQKKRARERALFRQEPEWASEEDRNPERVVTEEDNQKERRRRREEEWKKLEEERKRLKKEREKLKAKEKEEKQKEKDERRASRLPIRDRALNLLDFQKKNKQKEKPKTEAFEPEPEADLYSEKGHSREPTEEAAQLPSPPTHDPASTLLTIRNPDLPEEEPRLSSIPTHDPVPTHSRPTTPTTTDTDARSGSTTLEMRPSSSTSMQIQVETEPQHTPENSGLIRGVGTLERQNPANSGLVQDFGTLERARSLRANRGGLFRCCAGRRK